MLFRCWVILLIITTQTYLLEMNMRDVRSHQPTIDSLDEATLALVTELADQLHAERVAERTAARRQAHEHLIRPRELPADWRRRIV